MRALIALAASAGIAFSAMASATQFLAQVFGYQQNLGAPLIGRLYPPSSLFAWRERWRDDFPKPFATADLILAAGLVLAFAVGALALKRRDAIKAFGQGAWADFDDVRDADLFAAAGCVLGTFDGEILCFEGAGHQLLTGASRSGKGRGQVVPTLLAWPHSALVLDIKGELADGDPRLGFPGTAGFRQGLGPVLRFAPTSASSISFNPLFEVRKGANEVRDVQNLVEILADPQGEGRHHDFWDRSAKNILVGVILHVLYAEPTERKTLATVREKLRDLDATAELMKSTLHRLHPTSKQPEVHPEVAHAAESFLAGEERLQSGVKATAESFFGLFADEIIAAKTSRSDFRIGDLMCDPDPVTLYLQPPPSDALRLTPLLRLIINQIARALMEHQTADAQGRTKNHRLLLLLDEFPLLGRMPFFETMMGAMAGYGLKAFLVCQSLNHITKAYGRNNVILDNCEIVTAFAAADGDTAKRIADMAGEVWELRESETQQRPKPIFGFGRGSTTTREERRPLIMPSDVRALALDEELIFASGVKPIRAKKLKFDCEPVFVERLAAAPRHRETKLSTAHDWEGVAAFGVIPPQKRPRAKPALSAASTDQPDLLADAAARAAGDHATENAPPQAASSEPKAPQAQSRPRAKGI